VAGTPGQDEIRAAGAVLWRSGAGTGADLGGPVGVSVPDETQVEVALVHRQRYDDWSLPKGKQAPGEHILLTAVREVEEETGVRVVLGRRLPSTHYDRDGRPKVVDYWAAKPADVPQPGFQPNDEVDVVDWLPIPAARERLSYERDTWVLDEFASGPVDTTPFILLRHASAGSKHAWQAKGHSDDLLRPLDAEGRKQAEAVAGLLACFGKARVLSSAAERCVATVRPYAVQEGVAIEVEPAFTIGQADDRAIARAVEAVIRDGRPAVICGHRENLPVLLEEACRALRAKAPDGATLRMASFWVLQASGQSLASAELHHLVGE
jgi:8-oxo-dGTP diphosphatase